MKKQVLLVLLLLMVLGGAVTHAQTRSLINAKVPFDFVVNGRTYTSGDYSVLPTSTNHVWILRGTNRRSGFLVAQSAESSTPADRNKLVFRCYNSRKLCFLAEVWFSGDQIGSRLPITRHEKELTRAIPATPTIVATE